MLASWNLPILDDHGPVASCGWYPVDLFRNNIRQDVTMPGLASMVALLLWLFLTLSISWVLISTESRYVIAR